MSISPITFLLTVLLASSTAAQDEESPKVVARRSGIVEVVERVRPAVVSIDCQVPGMVGLFKTPISGTGVVIWDDGYIVTNYHVVASANHSGSKIWVRFDEEDDQRAYEAKLLSFERKEDLALLKIEGERPFPTIPLSTDPPMLGETVIAIGNSVGLSHTVSTGIISGLHRNLEVAENDLYFESLLQTDAAINPGNSGGPLIDVNGELIGINTAITRDAENVGYAIPVARVRHVLTNDLLSSSKAKSYFGYEIDEGTFEILKVYPGGPADHAGMQPRDVVLAIDGNPVEGEGAYGKLAVSVDSSTPVNFRVRRGGRFIDLQLDTWHLIKGFIHQRLGIRVEEVRLGRHGLRLQIQDVDPNGPAGRIDLQPNDIIAAIKPNGYRSRTLMREGDFAFLLSKLGSGTQLDIAVYRDMNDDQRFDLKREELRGKVKLR